MAATYAAPALGPITAGRRSFRPATSTRAVPVAGRPGLARRHSAPVGLRVTRRGRLVVLAVALLVVLLPGAWRAMATAQTEGPATVAISVQPGDTLWGIASAIDPGADPRALIAEIRELNALTSSGLVPGQVLVVPAG